MEVRNILPQESGDDAIMLIIPRNMMDELFQMGKEAYPNEGCGFLLGTLEADGEKRVQVLHRTTNINTSRPKDRFEIDPREFLLIEKEAKKDGREILGFFHSHPDHPANPSQFDSEMAWPNYSYLILSVLGGNEVAARSWIFDEESRKFFEEDIVIKG